MLPSLQAALADIFKQVGVTTPLNFTTPPNTELGDLAIPCFQLTTDDEKNPAAIAMKLAEALGALNSDTIVRAVATGPYLNITLATAVLGDHVMQAALQEWKAETPADKRQVLIEYPSNNTHKEFHIGHLRNVCIGNTLVRLLRDVGHDVTPVNYLNDFGSHVAKCLWGVLNLSDELPAYEPRQKWLGEMYAKASTKAKEDETVAAAVSDIQQRLEQQDPELWTLFEETRDQSVVAFKAFFAELGVEHDHVFLESAIKAKGQKIVDDLLEKKIATVGDGGAIIIDLEAYKLNVALVRKSDGTGLYLTSDLPLAEEKFVTYSDITESIVLTGKEQNFYFKQLYKILELLGYKQDHKHIGYGLVTLPEGKMSSRTGSVVLYEDLRNTVQETLANETRSRHPEWNDEQVTSTANALALAALKFTMQQHDVTKDIVFDINKAVSVEGYSAPYVMYSYVRVQSMKRKWGKEVQQPTDMSAIDNIQGKQLLLSMNSFAAVRQKAYEQYNPSVLTQYAFELAQLINGYYAHNQVLTDDEAQTNVQLYLLDRAASLLQHVLTLLSINVIEEM